MCCGGEIGVEERVTGGEDRGEATEMGQTRRRKCVKEGSGVEGLAVFRERMLGGMCRCMKGHDPEKLSFGKGVTKEVKREQFRMFEESLTF